MLRMETKDSGMQKVCHAQINAFALSVTYSSVINSSTSQKITNDIFHNYVLPFLDLLP